MKKAREILGFAVAGILAVSSLAGCSPDKGTPILTTSSSQGSGSSLTGILSINGSTSMEKMIGALSEKYSARHSGVNISAQATGSGDGIKAAAAGTADIGTSSRDLNTDEKEATPDLVATTVAYDGIAIVVNPKNKISSLTSGQIADIFSGKINNWKEVGGADKAILVAIRESGSGTRDGFEEKLNIKNKCVETHVCKETGIVKSDVSKDESAIGYMSLGSVDSSVKILAVDGVKPSDETVITGTYKIQRPFICVTKGQPKGLEKSFIDYVLSDEGQSIVQQQGFVKLKK